MLIFAVLLSCLMITVIISDFTRYIIPNWLVGLILLLYPVMVYCSPARPDWKMALLIGLAIFAVGFALFAFKIMGGGDIKLLTVASVWTGTTSTTDFFLWVAILGGIFSVVLIILRYVLAKAVKDPATLPRVFSKGQPAPYGVAIAIAFLALLWMSKIPGVVL